MRTAYLYDESGVYTAAVEFDPDGPLPTRSTSLMPPPLAGSEVAQWSGGAWLVLPAAPPPYIEPLADRVARAFAERDRLLSIAAFRMAPLQDAVDIDDATTAEVGLLNKWKQYRVALNRIQDQTEFPSAVTWPGAPE